MSKIYYLLFAFAICAGIIYCLHTCENKEPTLSTQPQIDKHIKAIESRKPIEAIIKDTLKVKREQKRVIAKENQVLRKELERFNSPIITDTTISGLSTGIALSKELIIGLTKEIVADSAVIEELDSLTLNLEADKIDLLSADSLHRQNEKQLIKDKRKHFWKGFKLGLGIGGIFGLLVALLL